MGLLLQRYGLGDALKAKAAEGAPIWGTCMGMILMAKNVIGKIISRFEDKGLNIVAMKMMRLSPDLAPFAPVARHSSPTTARIFSEVPKGRFAL